MSLEIRVKGIRVQGCRSVWLSNIGVKCDGIRMQECRGVGLTGIIV